MALYPLHWPLALFPQEYLSSHCSPSLPTRFTGSDAKMTINCTSLSQLSCIMLGQSLPFHAPHSMVHKSVITSTFHRPLSIRFSNDYLHWVCSLLLSEESSSRTEEEGSSLVLTTFVLTVNTATISHEGDVRGKFCTSVTTVAT